MRTTLFQKIILMLFGLLFCLCILEIGMRLCGGILVYLYGPENKRFFAEKGEYRVLCLGESTTARGGKDSWSTQLQDVLNERKLGGDFKIINAGREGVQSDFIVAKLKENLDAYKPDIVITMIGVNDESGTIAYKDRLDNRAILFARNLRVYKLFRWIYSNISRPFLRNQFTLQTRPNIDYGNMKNISNNNSGEVLRGQGKNQEAEQFFLKEIELNPKNKSAYFALMEIYKKQERYNEVELLSKKILAIKNDDYLALRELGVCYVKQGKIAEAESSFLKSIDIVPDFYAGYVELGYLYYDLKRYKDAEKVLNQAINIIPESEPAYTALALCYSSQGKVDDYWYLAQKIISSGVKNDRLYGFVATCYRLKGDFIKAKEYYFKAEQFRMKYYNPATLYNYQKIYELLTKRNIKLVCLQYPMRSIEPLKKLFSENHKVIYVENKQNFTRALRQVPYENYFTDTFGGDFGHCTRKGNRLIAENIASVLLEYVNDY